MSIKKILKYIIKVPLEVAAAQFGHHRLYSRESRLWIMMYHRILPQNDPRYLIEEPGMIVEPETFRMHLKTLKNEFTMISLVDWVNRKKKNLPLPLKACAITFDDGWLDNYEFAFPILQHEQIPATVFVVSDMIGTNQTFWPNRIQSILNQPTKKLKKISWLTDFIGNSNVTKELSASIILSLKRYSDTKLFELIAETENKLNISAQKSPVLINIDQLSKMSKSGLIDVGSHTCNHVRLMKGLSEKNYRHEISDSKKRLEEVIDKPVNIFCYPNGDYCDEAINVVAEYYDAAVSTYKGINMVSTTDLFTLSRFGIHQDVSQNKRQLLARISNWPI